MNPDRHSISTHFARCLLEKAAELALDTEHLLSHASLAASLVANPGLRITPNQLSRLMLEFWRLSDDEFMGMTGQPLRFGVFALLAKLLVNCHNLRAVYHRCSEFYNLVNPSVAVEFTTHSGQARLSLDINSPDRDPHGMMRELYLIIWHRFPSWLIGQRIALNCVNLQLPKLAHCAEHQLMYPCPVNYQQAQNSIQFDATWLEQPVVQTRQTLHAYLQVTPLEWFKRQAYYPVYTRRVKVYLERQPEWVAASMENAAAELQITSRTLRRKLTAEGTSFQLLKDEVRADAAIHYLSQPTLSINEVSSLLGFSEPAAFTRAFKHWFGVAPSAYRQ